MAPRTSASPSPPDHSDPLGTPTRCAGFVGRGAPLRAGIASEAGARPRRHLLPGCASLADFDPERDGSAFPGLHRIAGFPRRIASSLVSELEVVGDARSGIVRASLHARLRCWAAFARDGAPIEITGQVDRIAVSPGRVQIADYKTNRPAPTSLDAVPPAYVRQLALYRALLARLYPDRPIEAAIVWTDGPVLMELPPDALDAALAEVTAA